MVTPLGVWLPGRPERLGWHQVHKATWSGGRLTVIPAAQVGDGDGYAVMADDTPVVVGLPDPDDVPDEVRKRVTKSVAYTAALRAARRRGARGRPAGARRRTG